MVDEYQGLTTPGEDGKPQPNAGAPEAEVKPETPITKAELAALKDELLRAIQSQTGKAESRVKKEVDAKLAEVTQYVSELRAAGYQPTDAEIASLKATALREGISASRQDAGSQPASPANPIAKAEIEKTNAAALQMQRDYGYILQDYDPEVLEIKTSGTAEEYLTSVEEAVKTAMQRKGISLPERQQGNPSARLGAPTGGATGGLDAIVAEVEKLQAKPNRTAAEEMRRKQLEAEALKHIPRR